MVVLNSFKILSFLLLRVVFTCEIGCTHEALEGGVGFSLNEWDVVGTGSGLSSFTPGPPRALCSFGGGGVLRVCCFFFRLLAFISVLFFVFVFLVLILNIKPLGVWGCDT